MKKKEDPRVSVAKDVLAQLAAKRYTPSQVTYLEIVFEQDFPRKPRDLQEIVDLPMRRCEVCAKGALLLSKARLFNNVPMRRITSDENQIFGGYRNSLLRDTFTEEQLELVEHAFEEWEPDGLMKPRKKYDMFMRAYRFGKRFRNTKNRMKAIMQNIIDNGGEFNP